MLVLLLKRSVSANVNLWKDGRKATISNSAKLIIQLHKDNKDLFGDLLESSKQRRKKTAKVQVESILTDNGKPNLASELWWWKKTPDRIVKLRMSWKNNSNCFKANSDSQPVQLGKHNVGGSRNQPSRKVVSSRTKTVFGTEDSDIIVKPQIKVDKLILNSNVLEIVNIPEYVSNTHTGNLDISEKLPSLDVKLPDIIIRNIPNFPLWRRNKNAECSKNSVLSLNKHEGIEDSVFLSYPSVTKILNATMSDKSRLALDRWKKNMILQLGEVGFASFQKDLLQQGSKFHMAIKKFLSGTSSSDIGLEPCIEGCWKSVATVLPYLSNVRVLESHVKHSYLKYQGVIDCVARYHGKLLLIDWKRSDRQKTELAHTYDAPLQICAYIGALNYDDNYEIKLKGGLVVVAYTDGSPAHIFKLDASECDKYWKLWLLRLQKYWLEQK